MIPQVPPADLVQQQRHFFTFSRELGCSSWDSSEHCRIYCSKNFYTSTYGGGRQVQQCCYVFSSDAKESIQMPV